MSEINLMQLVKRLDVHSKKALENATQYCVTNQHAEVQIEHWLMQLITNNSEIERYFQQAGSNPDQWRQALVMHTQQLPKNYQGVAKLSILLAQLLNDCVTEVMLDLQQNCVSGLMILYTFIRNLRERLWPVLPCHQILLSLDLEALKNQILQQPVENTTLINSSEDPLTLYATNLTLLAKQGKLDAVLHRDKEIQQMMDVLSRRRQNNPMLVGEAGVGKTALVEGLALRIVEGHVPEALKKVQLYSLDLAALQAGTGIQGEFEQRLKNLVQRVQQSKEPIILFIDEVHNLMGAGGKQGQGDAANLLKPLLARGELRTIAATTWMEYKKHIENDAALTRRFEVIRVLEPNDHQAFGMLLGSVAKLEKHHHVLISVDAITAAVKLSRRYLPNRQLPDKAVSLLDTACARVQLSQHNTPRIIYDLQEEIQQLTTQAQQLQRHQSLGENYASQFVENQQQLADKKEQLLSHEAHWQRENVLFNELKKMRDQLLSDITSENRAELQAQYQALLLQFKQVQGEKGGIALQVDEAIVAEVIASLTGIPAGRLLSSELSVTMVFNARLKERVLGQSLAIDQLAKKLQTARVSLQDPNKPQGVFLLVGNSGIGKTETAHAVAELLYGGKEFLTVINMSEFKESHKVSMLTGAPAGYVGYGEGGILTEAIRRRPFGVVLLDEMEKAHSSIQDIFYQVFDKGVLCDGQGSEIDCRHTVFLMTSNAGSSALANVTISLQEDEQARLQEELLQHFKLAFLSRTTILPYLNLNKEILTGISRLKLQAVIDRLHEQHKMTLSYTERLLQQLSHSAENSIRNAREIDQQIESALLPELSHYVLEVLLQHKKQKATLVFDYSEKRGYFLK